MYEVAEDEFAATKAVNPLDHDTLCRITVKGKALPYIPLEIRTFHDEILHPPEVVQRSDGSSYEEPPCVNGENCLGLQPCLGGPGNIILRARPNGMTALLQERETGIVSCHGSPCLLCERMDMAVHVVEAIQKYRQGQVNTIHQQYRVGTSPGDSQHYHADNCFNPVDVAEKTPGLVLLAPVLHFSLDDYNWVQLPDGRWRLNQDRLSHPKP